MKSDKESDRLVDEKSNSEEQLRLVESRCRDFESNWNPDSETEHIFHYVESVPSSVRLNLLQELAAIDMELRWQAWATVELQRFSRNQAPHPSKSRIPDRHSYGEVLGLPDLGEELAEQEIWCRARFGDLPSQGLAVAMPRLKIKILLGPTFESEFAGPISGGRQNSNETTSLGWSDKNPSRVIVTSKDDDTVSRQQFSIRFHTDQLAFVKNESGNRAFCVVCPEDIDKGKVLDSQHEHLFQFPFILKFTQQEVRFARDV